MSTPTTVNRRCARARGPGASKSSDAALIASPPAAWTAREEQADRQGQDDEADREDEEHREDSPARSRSSPSSARRPRRHRWRRRPWCSWSGRSARCRAGRSRRGRPAAGRLRSVCLNVRPMARAASAWPSGTVLTPTADRLAHERRVVDRQAEDASRKLLSVMKVGESLGASDAELEEQTEDAEHDDQGQRGVPDDVHVGGADAPQHPDGGDPHHRQHGADQEREERRQKREVDGRPEGVRDRRTRRRKSPMFALQLGTRWRSRHAGERPRERPLPGDVRSGAGVKSSAGCRRVEL